MVYSKIDCENGINAEDYCEYYLFEEVSANKFLYSKKICDYLVFAEDRLRLRLFEDGPRIGIYSKRGSAKNVIRRISLRL